MSRRLLPIGIQTFRTIREEDFYYVDKTPLIHRLVTQGRHYFLSRPRRFGKSLLLDTLRELFADNEPLFRGLHIHDRWDWGTAHPVVRLSFAGNFAEQLRACLAGLPHQWRDSGYLGQFESHYAAMLYLTFRAVGADVRAEEASLQGRADMVLLHGGQVFVLEFKMVKDGQGAAAAEAEAMDQMRERGYADKYRGGKEPVHLIGVVFGSQERNLLTVRAEPA